MWTTLSAGERIDDRYEIAIGPKDRADLMGGMGCVYLCHDRQTGRLVALKTFRPEFTGHGVRDRLLRETATWARLGGHENIVQILGLSRPDDGSLYLVLQFVGPSLRLRGPRFSSVPAKLQIALDVARGMAHAVHRVPGLVHRDLKPENVLIAKNDIARVTDFGLAQTAAALDSETAVDASGRKTFIRNGIAGTPAYMAPEQWITTGIDHRADIYALGCILKELITNRPAVAGDGVDSIAESHLRGRAADLIDVPPALQELLLKMVATSPNARYSSWQEVVAALDKAYVTSTGNRSRDVGAVATDETVKGEANAFLAITGAYMNIGNRGAAADAVAHARRLSESARDAELAIRVTDLEAVLLLEIGRPREAIPLLKSLLELYQSKGSALKAAQTLGNLGQAQRTVGDLAGSLRSSEAALKLFRRLGDQLAIGLELLHKANTHALLNQYDEAVACHTESALVADALGNEALVGMNVLRMALFLVASGNVVGGRVSLRYANLLYARVGREDYARDVHSIRERFINEGLFSQEPFELALDALFAAAPDPQGIAQIAVHHPSVLDANLIGTLLHATAPDVGTECLARAIREQGAILAALSLAIGRNANRTPE